MKLSNTVVSAIIIVAILVSAYALGLLIRQARTGGSRVQAPAEVNHPVRPTVVASPRPGEEHPTDTPEQRAEIRDQREQALKDMSTQTPEERQKFREQIRKQVGGRQPGKKIKGPGQAAGGARKGAVNAPTPPDGGMTTKPGAEKAGDEAGQADPGGVQP